MDMIQAARELGKAIQQDEAFIKMMTASQVNDADQNLQALIGEFNLKKIDLNTELSKEDKDQEKINAINTEVREIYTKIMQNENMIAYNTAKGELDEKIDFVMQILRGSIEGEDPSLIERSSGGCSGSCSSCSGCH